MPVTVSNADHIYTIAFFEPTLFLRWVLFIEILWVLPQHEQRDGAYQYASVKVPKNRCIVIGSIEEIAVGPGQENII